MIDTQLLIDWIHRVEWDQDEKAPTKRRPSLITELYFRTLTKESLEIDISPVTGWTRHFDRERRRQLWFKVKTNDAKIKKGTSKEFVADLLKKRTDQEFFSVDYEITYSNGAPTVEFNVQEFAIDNGNLKLKPSALANSITNSVNSRVSEVLHQLVKLDAGHELTPWLADLSITDLSELYATRCWMNYSDLHLVDIDGITKDLDGKLTIMEFKRKDPSKGPRLVAPEANSFWIYMATAGKLNAKAAKQPKRANSKKPLAVEAPKEWASVTSPCFGLDTTHAGNVQLCADLGWNYRYIVWNTPLTQPSELFDEHLVPLNDVELLLLDVTPSHFTGISTADESGSYTVGKNRYQLMIEVKNFRRINP